MPQLIKKKTRLTEIDIAKGLCIILVIAGHLVSFNGNAFRIIFAFHMPFFFLCSGFCTTYSLPVNSFKKTIYLLTKKLLVPSLIVRIMVAFYLNQADFADGMRQIFLTPSTEWFFSSLFFIRLIDYIINRFARNHKYHIYAIILLLAPTVAQKYLLLVSYISEMLYSV